MHLHVETTTRCTLACPACPRTTWHNITKHPVKKEDLDREIKPLLENVKILQSENSKLKSEIGTLNSKLSTSIESIDSLRTKTRDNSNAITQTANQLGIQI